MKAVIFDFDGVIVDTERQRFKAIQQVLKRRDMYLPDSEFKEMEGKKTTFFLRNEFPHLKDKEIEKIAEERREEEYNHLDHVKILNGVRKVFEFLKKKRKTIAVCSGSQRKIVKSLLNMHGLSKYVKVLVTGEDFEASKPHPESYIVTLKKLRMQGEDVIVIEDAPAGIEAANIAGCVTFGLETYSTAKQFIGADKSFKNHSYLLKHLKSLLG